MVFWYITDVDDVANVCQLAMAVPKWLGGAVESAVHVKEGLDASDVEGTLLP